MSPSQPGPLCDHALERRHLVGRQRRPFAPGQRVEAPLREVDEQREFGGRPNAQAPPVALHGRDSPVARSPGLALQAKRVSREATTVDLYERTIRTHILPKLGANRARSLTPTHIARVIAEAVDVSPRKTNGRPLSPTARRSLRTLVGSVCEYGVRTDVLVRNPAKLVEIPNPPHRESQSYTLDDIAALIEASVGSTMHALIVVALGMGLRRGELCGVKWSDVDVATGEFRLERNAKNVGRTVVLGKLKTRKSARRDVLPPFCREALKAHRVAQVGRHLALGIRDPDGFIFDAPAGGGSDPNEVSRSFHPFIQRTGVKPLRFHDTRHIAATRAFACGVTLKAVLEMLGHSSVAITSAIYVDVVAASKHDKAGIIDRDLRRRETRYPKCNSKLGPKS